jgi:CubicO group peptidase (beta-lactamase class C family)
MRALVLAITTTAFAAPAAAQSPDWTRFTEALAACARSDGIVGLGAVLVRDGRIAARYNLGLADRDRRQPATDSTLYHYASITKTLTAVAIMQLRDRGLLSLDDPATRWVPELRRVHNPFGSMDAITVRMLLSHTAGFQNSTWPYGRGLPWEPFEPTEWFQLVAMMPYQEILFQPGSRFGYSNPAFIYLARIIEALTGDAWQSYVQKNILAPLSMTRSYFGITPPWLAAHRSNGYAIRSDSAGRGTVVTTGREFDPGITIPNGGWNGPLDDLARWLAFLAGNTGPEILARATLEEMWRPVVERAPDMWEGLSFEIRRGEPRLVSHTGDQGGFHSEFVLNPAARVAVAFVFNTSPEDGGRPGSAACTALDGAARPLLGAAP